MNERFPFHTFLQLVENITFNTANNADITLCYVHWSAPCLCQARFLTLPDAICLVTVFKGANILWLLQHCLPVFTAAAHRPCCKQNLTQPTTKKETSKQINLQSINTCCFSSLRMRSEQSHECILLLASGCWELFNHFSI